MYCIRGSGYVRAMVVALVIAGFAPLAYGQGVTTGNITGVVVDPQGAVVPGVTVVALHQPSGTTYEGVTRADGRFFIPGHARGRAVQGHGGADRVRRRGAWTT